MNRRVEIDRWGIKYDGTPKSMSVQDFIFRIEILQQSHNCSWEDILRNFHILLSGSAQEWYWQNLRTNVRPDWPTLKQALYNQFRGYDSDIEIIQQITERRQNPQECFDDYFNCIIHLKNQLKRPMAERQLLHILKSKVNNKLFHLIYPMPIYSLEHFRDECRRAEKLIQSRDQNRFIRQHNVNEIEYEERPYDFQCMEDKPEICAIHEANNQKDFRNYRCFNCKKPGHSFMNCPSPVRNLFCYRCGADNVTTPNCQNCKNKENRKSSETKIGESRSVQKQPEN